MSLEGKSLGELKRRRAICHLAVVTIIASNDPRAPEAEAHYRAQLANLDAEVTRLEKEARRARGEPEPETQSVGLKTAKLVGRIGRSK